MDNLIATYQEYINTNNPVVTFTPGTSLSELPQDIRNILIFDSRTTQRIKILSPEVYSQFTCKDTKNEFILSSEGYMEAFDKELFSNYLLNYSKIK